ncbi:MAG: hypothetical protein AB1725_01355 [Armatimonadota bacterium]
MSLGSALWMATALIGGITFEEASAPQEARMHLPVEVRIQASGNWTNPYDPNEVSVSARVVGSRELAADVPAFWFEGFEWSDGQWTATGESGWRLRFAPWNAGGYGLFVRGFDLDGAGDLPKVAFDVRAVSKESEPPAYGFVEPVNDRPAFTVARRDAFVPVGVYLDSLPLTPPDIRRLVITVRESGANLMSVPLFGAGWTLERELLSYDQQAAHRLDLLLEAAQEQGVRVLLRLEGGPQQAGGLPASLRAYAGEGGGACETLDEFWTSLRARQVYKKKLRYLLARNAWRSSLLGVQFFEGFAPPSWWLDEMAQLVYDLHPYLVVQAAERSEESPGDSLRLNLALLESAAGLRRWRERSKKPALIIPKQGEPADVRQAWRDVMAGASGAMLRGIPIAAEGGFGVPATHASPIRQAGSLAALRDALYELPWTTAPVDAQRVESPYPFAAALLSDSRVVLYVEGPPEVESALPQTIRVPIRRDGTYEAQWKDALTGRPLGEPERARHRDTAEILVPSFGSAAVCTLRRVGR